MGIITYDNLEPGMVLASDVKDRSGRILLAAGNPVTEKALRIFKMWGVTEADVEGVAQEELSAKKAANLNPEILRKTEERLNELFIHCDREHPAIKELYRLATIRSAQKLEESNGTPSQSA